MLVLGLVGAAIGIAVSGYWTVIAWRSSIDQWRAVSLSLRPASWEHWPIYGPLWRRFDAHPSAYLWQMRVLAPLGLVFFLGVAALLGLGLAR